ncbi:UV-endonuclease UvdE-domain-containing protein [Xylaria bambusicola]|uniref:UV-endonuclease UvdE-domain-containing protein n=1 Tax=Xylaria bambusicola TaxID=326684 RepID=UPI00200890CE|nr:UV-endonuclease UvdE-domain-containing protein [Xylaria bambusicola]KAI0508920.1 UV-endonuclease UvdE-domain-containing protein [Xylaria bambusicola]
MLTSGLRSLVRSYEVLSTRRPLATQLFSDSLTMALKRKKSTMALMPSENNLDERSIPGQRTDAPRRSGRLLDKDNQTSHPQLVDGLTVTKQIRPGYTKVKRGRDAEIPEGEAQVAVTSLQEMENQFRNECKRQKRAIKESHVKSNKPTDDEYAVFMPRVVKGQREILSASAESNALKRVSGPGSPIYPKDDAEEETKKLQAQEEDEFVLGDNDINIIKQEGARPPPVNSEYLPLPWKGRLGYACLNTYLRNSNPPVFSSRTCRIASILENRHPLQDPSQPAHATKNRPDKDQPPDVERGQKYVEGLGLANARDIVKMLRWNDKYGIKFMRLSSEMFPFASHETYGYKLAPFASDVLAEAGRVAAELGHRLTTHPGQFTQLGSPRNEVVKSAVRDLEYHHELLSLLRLPKQLDKDAVMIIHMGGVFGDKAATLDRFRENYAKLSDGVKARLVLENDDVSWTVHDILPICEELNIPMVLDYHHHNIMFNKDLIREGTQDIMELYPRIKATWDRKGITQKMHYSEPCSDAVTPRQRRKHRPRVLTLPPCPDTMDLMIEAKDKEQAVFDLMRNFRLPGWDTFNDVVPYERQDENRPLPKPSKKKKKQQRKKKGDDDEVPDDVSDEPEPAPPPEVPDAELGMGGPERRVYWPIGMEEWLRPRKREVKKKAKVDEEDLGTEKV